MGVKDLWNILSPLCERRPLFELQGKTIAIDMSCWVVDSQTITDNSVQPKMYLRNLYFRTAFLLMQGILPVFVLEGKAPVLKHNTIARRNNARNGFPESKTSRTSRSQFGRILKECKEMLEYMGLACVQSQGEAEAMCAYLNEDGLVDGCITQDSDCFLYGAKVVYRNFCSSAQGNRGGTGGAVDEYKLEKIEKILALGRNKMIALALLCGCDYGDGINGVGKEAALKLFKIVNEEDILERLKSWRNDNMFDRKEIELSSSEFCSSCGHSGKVQKHAKSGCIDCGTVVKCNTSYKEKRTLILNEIALRKKALLIEDFPNQELINEFLIRKDPIPTKIDIQWKQPQMNKFIDFMDRKLSWEPQYAFEKIFPLVTRWQLLHLPNISAESRLTIPDLFIPEAIKKIRNIRSVASYEIIWKAEHVVIERLKEYIASEKENEDGDANFLSELTTIEPQVDVQKCYPNLVDVFQNAKSLKAKKRPAKNKVKTGENAEKRQTERGRRKKGEKPALNVEKNKKIDDFICKNPPVSLEESFEMMSITPKRSKKTGRDENEISGRLKRGPQIEKVLASESMPLKLNNTLETMFNELTPDDFISDNDDQDLNMSDIINNICSKRIFQFNVEEDSQTGGNENSTPETHIEDFKPSDNIVNTEMDFSQFHQNSAIYNESVDEFADINESYVPLNQRILPSLQKLKLPKGVTETNNRFSLGFDALMNDTDPEQLHS